MAGYHLPVVREITVGSREKIAEAAEEVGYPVVIKGMGATLLHKTERGIVHLNLKTESELMKAAIAIEQECGDELEGFLVQPFLEGKREFVAGMFRDDQFGPMVMFGIGGVLTEALSDVVFRAAPLTDADIADMLEEIRSKALLDDFRGEKAINRDQIVDTLKGLSQISMKHEDIAEIDINPLLADTRGNLTAVDALVIQSEPKATTQPLPAIPQNAITAMINPKSIAFIGASNTPGKWGYMLAMNTLAGSFKGKTHMVNPKGGVVLGHDAYKSVADIPGEVDLAVVTIPARFVLDLIPQLEEKNIRSMLLITSGFSETGEEGRWLEQELVDRAREAGITILGPNIMGLCNPHLGLNCNNIHVHPPAGHTWFISQSGNMGMQLLTYAEEENLGIRGFCGTGNEAMVTKEDFLETFEHDDLTRTIMLYVESLKNGRRFFDTARRVSQAKPIILLKGGRSQSGNAAASSHTGAMTSDAGVFDALCKQSGIIQVTRPMEMLDLAASFSSLPLPRGNRVAIMTLGGGWGVITADMCEDYGLQVPELTPELIQRFDELLPDYWSRSNPLDLVGETDGTMPRIVLEELMKWDGCDAVIHLGVIGTKCVIDRLSVAAKIGDPNSSPETVDMIRSSIQAADAEYNRFSAQMMEQYQKPVYGVRILSDAEDQTVNSVEGSDYSGVLFTSPERAVKSLARMVDYRKYQQRHA